MFTLFFFLVKITNIIIKQIYPISHGVKSHANSSIAVFYVGKNLFSSGKKVKNIVVKFINMYKVHNNVYSLENYNIF